MSAPLGSVLYCRELAMAERKHSTRPGDPVPDVVLLDENGAEVKLRDLVTDRPLVICFYPKDGTPVCTMEACRFRDAYDDFRGLDARVVGISSDPPDSHRAFSERHGLPFPLLSDPDGAARRAFGTGKTLGILDARVTYVADASGIVRHVFSSQFRPGKHVREALRGLRELGSHEGPEQETPHVRDAD
jgi:peroxiredoxin Q/BCP